MKSSIPKTSCCYLVTAFEILSVTVQDAVAASLLNVGILRTGLPYDGEPDLDDILADTQGGLTAPQFSQLPR